MGTMVQQHKLDEAAVRGERFRDHRTLLKNNIDLLVLTRPEMISAIHHAYLEAGADIIETNTFGSTSIAQADFGLESLAYELNVAAARLARAAADDMVRETPDSSALRRRRDRTDQPHAVDLARRQQPGVPRRDIRRVREAYREQVRGLIDGGADLLLLETIFDTLNAKAAIAGMLDEFEARGTSSCR